MKGHPTALRGVSGVSTLRALSVPTVSIVIPTRNEAENIGELMRRIGGVLRGATIEVIFVDDSDDDTGQVVEAIRPNYEHEVVFLHREPGHRDGGLGGAVVEGMRAARGEWVVVMDADLQHPPEVIDELLAEAEESERDLVVASRYVPEGHGESLGALRSLISKGSTVAARLLFPKRVRVSDPMSGFFLVRRNAIRLESLRPKGFKILLEIMVRTPRLRMAEVPFEFGKRFGGESKASVREGLTYLSQLWRLRFGEKSRRLSRFAAVGISGLAVNTLLLAAFAGVGGLHYLAGAILATQGSTAWNFALTESWVFRDRRGGSRLGRMAAFFAVNNGALSLRGPMLVVLVSALSLHYLVANVITLAVIMLARYALADTWIWGRRSMGGKGESLVHSYNIHGIVSVDSDVTLPELAQFRVAELSDAPTIRVRLGRPSKNTAWREALPAAAAEQMQIQYAEGLGPFGFEIGIRMGEPIDVLASRILKYSPHVLYTNVVEPVLRWTFVERGYALVHGACLADGEDAYLITARTDTGKTTTILKALDANPWSFLSDDLTLVSPDGRVLRYPKPLTISRHTLHAVKRPLLSLRQRLMLFYQSRIHSRSGRKMALGMSRSKLPMATVNAVAQFVVPPPKYPVQKLVPGVTIAREAKLAGLVIIERGADTETKLGPAEALEILMQNCEDAYGFPPYRSIEGFLHSRNGSDLKARERSIVASAFRGLPTWLLRSESMNWAQRLPTIIGGTAEVLTPAGSQGPLPSPATG